MRRNNDISTLKIYLELLKETREIIKVHILSRKLWRRFWNTIEAYNNGDSCADILKKYFGLRYKAEIMDHRRIGKIN